MPELDVSELTIDPDLAATQFLVIRRVQVMNAFGERTNQVQRFAPFGQVAPTGDNSLVREDSYQMAGKSIQVITAFRLRMAAKDNATTYDPDIVIWRGDSYVVKSVEDYSQFGAGMIVAECGSIDYVDQAPMLPVSPL